MRNYYFQLLLLSWNYLDPGQPLRNFSICHNPRSNFPYFQHLSEHKFTNISPKKLVQKVPRIINHQQTSITINLINKSQWFEENCQIFRFRTHFSKKKFNQLIHFHIPGSKVDLSSTDKYILIKPKFKGTRFGKIIRYPALLIHNFTTNNTSSGFHQRLAIKSTKIKPNNFNNTINLSDNTAMNILNNIINLNNSEIAMEVIMETTPGTTLPRGCKRSAESDDTEEAQESHTSNMDIIEEVNKETQPIVNTNDQTIERDATNEPKQAEHTDTEWEVLIPILNKIQDYSIPLPAEERLQDLVQDQVKTPTTNIS